MSASCINPRRMQICLSKHWMDLIMAWAYQWCVYEHTEKIVPLDQIMPILNNLRTHSHIDALSYYIYNAWYVIVNSIARQPFGLGKADRGQSLLFHEFIQSWVGYELVKVLVTFGLQPTHLNCSLKEWSQDLHDIFTYMQTEKLSWKGELLKYLMCSSTTQYIVDTGAMSSSEQRKNLSAK